MRVDARPTPRVRLWANAAAAGSQQEAQPASDATAAVETIVDQHANTHLPSAAELMLIAAQIISDPTVVRPTPWNPTSAKSKALAAELTAVMKQRLDREMLSVNASKVAPKVDLAAFGGAGHAAKRIVDARFGGFARAAALTERRGQARAGFDFVPGQQLLDRTNPKHFTPDPLDAARWIAESDKDAEKLQAKYHFDKDRSEAEASWLEAAVVVPFARNHAAELRLYDIYAFGGAEDGKVQIAPVLGSTLGFSALASGDGAPSPAERALRWRIWELFVHEYIHVLEHPAFMAARHENRTLSEGVCEMFGGDVLESWIPIARSDGNAELRRDVEGANWPRFDPKFVPPYDPGDYADHAKRAKAVRVILGAGGENAVRAAFFQGHIELIGLAPTGHVAAPPSGPPAPAGMRYHRVVGVEGAVETLDQIATQNGVTVAALQATNPVACLKPLKVGANVLIPAH